jgi:hypothetical protein
VLVCATQTVSNMSLGKIKRPCTYNHFGLRFVEGGRDLDSKSGCKNSTTRLKNRGIALGCGSAAGCTQYSSTLPLFVC